MQFFFNHNIREVKKSYRIARERDLKIIYILNIKIKVDPYWYWSNTGLNQLSQSRLNGGISANREILTPIIVSLLQNLFKIHSALLKETRYWLLELSLYLKKDALWFCRNANFKCLNPDWSIMILKAIVYFCSFSHLTLDSSSINDLSDVLLYFMYIEAACICIFINRFICR